jgi:hypothetical protein
VFHIGIVIDYIFIESIIIIIVFEMATVLALLVVVVLFCGDEEWKKQRDVLFLVVQSFRELQRFF